MDKRASTRVSPPQRRPPTPGDAVVPRRRYTLDGFADEVSQTAGVDLTALDPITRLLVRTENSLYRITVREPHRRAVWVQGGSFFPETTSACLSGSSFGGSYLKMAWVGIGLHMEFHDDGQWIITSRVRSIAMETDSSLPGPQESDDGCGRCGKLSAVFQGVRLFCIQ